ncbi:MAG TPA: DMT family transporter [Thermoplasmata archaeon]|nr:DMT family transporter [Thermoplasmata archaeon]
MASRPVAAVALAVVSVSFSSIFIVWSASDALTIAVYRLAMATAILAPFALARRDAALWRISRRDALLMLLVGAVLAAHFGLWVTSLKVQGVTVASSTILVTSHPLLVGVLSHFVLRERISSRAALGIVLGFSGVVAIALADLGVSGETLLGDVFAFLGGVGAGFYFLLGRRIRQRVALVDYAFVVYGSATAFLFVAAAIAGDLAPRGDLPRELLLFLGMAFIPQIGGHTLYNWSLRWVPAPVVSLSLVGEPIGSSLLAWVLLSQVPSPAVGLGGALALAGIYLAASAEGGGVRTVEATRDIE